MLVSKERRPDGKGYKCRYDKPRTPYQRVPDEHVHTPGQEAALKAYRARLGGMDLYRRVLKRLRKIRHIQAAYTKARHEAKTSLPSRLVLPWCFAPPLRGRLDFTAKGRTTLSLTIT